MSRMIPEDVLLAIQDRCDIVEIVSGYLPLKKAGRNFKALCPFHHEKTPSFIVNPDKQIFHCFGCGVGGNVFNFLMRHERMEFPEAVEYLAGKVNIVIPKRTAPDKETVSLYEQLYRLNDTVMNFYHQLLLGGDEAAAAREYLEKRKIGLETIKRFRLGYAPDKWDAAMNFLRPKGFALSLIEKAGLILPRERGAGYYDRFRNRIIFPIFDIKSRCIAFGARVLDSSLPKYLNSPETPVYVKGNNLYGLNLSRDAIREADFAIIVEGYMDFISVFESGVENCIATSGTALTSEQIRLLKRFSHNAVLLFDADEAGVMATLRSLDLFLEEGMNVRVTNLEQGDPDAFIKKFGAAAFREKLKAAAPLFDYKFKLLSARYNPTTVEGKAKICKEMLPTINRFKDAVLKSEYLKKLAERLEVNEDALRIELAKIKEPRPLPSLPVSAESASDIRAVEKTLIKLLLEEERFIELLKENLSVSDFKNSASRRIVDLILKFCAQGIKVSPSKLISCTDDEIASRAISRLCAEEVEYHEDKEKIFEECVERLRQERIKERCKRLQNAIRLAETSGEGEKLLQLIQEYNHLIKK
ncbi:MAG: DNA primase [Candidatus Omnitrophota bacterium]